MHFVVFDIDGTLVQSYGFDTTCFVNAAENVLNVTIDRDWTSYPHVTDSGILDHIVNINNLTAHREHIHTEVKRQFINNVSVHLANNPIKAIKGAAKFISQLSEQDEFEVAIATGGWRETAELKLSAANINFEGLIFSSASDHFSRVDIMRAAESQAQNRPFASKTYFGDALWDKTASQELGYNFILVGNRIQHTQQINDYSKPELALSLIQQQLGST